MTNRNYSDLVVYVLDNSNFFKVMRAGTEQEETESSD